MSIAAGIGRRGLCGNLIHSQRSRPCIASEARRQTPCLVNQGFSTNSNSKSKINHNGEAMERLSKLISKHATNMTMSRREAERLIHQGEVTVAGKQVSSPHLLLSWKDAQSSIRVSGKHAHIVAEENSSSSSLSSGTKVWLVHKLAGEVVSDQDPHGRPSMLARLAKGGVGKRGKKQKDHLKAIGRLDMSTEGLILVTNDGHYKRQLELPSNVVHRVYRVRVHGKLTPYKLKMMRSGVTIDGIHYNGMKVQLETTSTTTRQQQQSSSRSNTWLRVTCTEGKNRQIRKVFEHFGLNVTRLIRISYGDYDLLTIPPGMAIQVPVKPWEQQKRVGRIATRPKKATTTTSSSNKALAPPIEWIRYH